MTMLLCCDQCGRTEHCLVGDRDRPPRPWLKLHDPVRADGRDYYFCSPRCRWVWVMSQEREIKEG